MQDLKFAAIDIGSNAVRLLLARVFVNDNELLFKKESLVRVPIRLGDDVFKKGSISEHKIRNLISTMTAFKYLIEAYEAIDYAACATSAMRDASNGANVTDAIRQKCGIDIQMIDGPREAEIIFGHHFNGAPYKSNSSLFIDVGGGSTEITIVQGPDTVSSASFNIGTIRILENLVTARQWDEMKKWIKSTVKNAHPELAIGTGGNINKVFRLIRQKEGRPISLRSIKALKKKLASLTLSERIRRLQLRPDRADVIIPAADIFVSILKWSGIDEIYVPQAGLSDGLIRYLYNEYAKGSAVTSDGGVVSPTEGDLP